MIKGKKWIGLMLSFVMLISLFSAVVLAEEEADVKTVYILHTNDTHARVIGDNTPGEDGKPIDAGVIGYARYKAIIDAMKAANDDMVLVLDAGDTFHGTNFASLSKGQSVVRLLNDMGLDAMTPGNHDFNYGFDELEILMQEADFPVLAANVVKEGTDEKVFDGSLMLEVGDLKVGVLAVTTPETKVKSSPVNTEGLEFINEAEAAEAEVAKLKEDGAQAIVMLSHLGLDEESEITTKTVLDEVEGIDVVIDGHSHHTFEEGELYNDTLITMTGNYLENVGLITLTFTDGELTETKAELISFLEATQYGQNEALVESIAAIEEENKRFTEVDVAVSKVVLDGEREDVRAKETNLGNLITDAMRWATDADVVITNGGGIRASIDAGMITMGDLLTVLPFGNMVTVIEVTGADILAALEFGVDAYPAAAGKFPHVSNITYTIVTKDDGTAGIEEGVLVGGEPLDLEATYKLATNDFMAIGGDGYTMFEGKEQLLLEGLMVDVVRDYILHLTEDGSELEIATDGRIGVAE